MITRQAELFNSLLRTFEASDFGKNNRCEGEGQAQEQLRNKERAKVTIVRRRLDGTGNLVVHLSRDHIEIVQVFGAELTQRQGEIRK